MTPEWLFQVMWWGAGVGGSGAFWYFMSQQSYRAALWTGFATIVVVLLSVALYIQNNLLRNEQQPATTNLSPGSGRPALENLTVTPFEPQRPEESKVNLQEETPAEKETLIETYPPVPTAQNMTAEQALLDLTSDKAIPAPAPERPTIREKSAAEILGV